MRTTTLERRHGRGCAVEVEAFDLASSDWLPAVDQPSGLAEQLDWLRAAGFAAADCAWLYAGHAIYGGAKRTSAAAALEERYSEMLAMAATVLRQRR